MSHFTTVTSLHSSPTAEDLLSHPFLRQLKKSRETVDKQWGLLLAAAEKSATVSDKSATSLTNITAGLSLADTVSWTFD